MKNLLNKIDTELGAFRLCMITGDTSNVAAGVQTLKADAAAVASNPEAKKYAQAADAFCKDFPKYLDEFAASAGKDEKKATKALDSLAATLNGLKALAEGQPADRNHI